MSISRPHRGGASVGRLADLDPVEAGAVLCLRLWCDGPAARTQVRGDFAKVLGPEVARRALNSFEELCDLCVSHGRRPLIRHHLTCQCLGADEACFATFIAAATEGARDDAILIATILVRADIAFCLIDHAQAFGLALKRMALKATLPVPPPAQDTFH